MISEIKNLLIAPHPLPSKLFWSQQVKTEVTWVIHYLCKGCLALFRQELECQKTVQGRSFLRPLTIRKGCGHSSSSWATEAGCPAAKNAACPGREQEWGVWDHKHVCSVSETSLLVSRPLRNAEPPPPSLGHSLTMTRRPSPILPLRLISTSANELRRRTDSLDLITDKWRSLWTLDKMEQT